MKNLNELTPREIHHMACISDKFRAGYRTWLRGSNLMIVESYFVLADKDTIELYSDNSYCVLDLNKAVAWVQRCWTTYGTTNDTYSALQECDKVLIDPESTEHEKNIAKVMCVSAFMDEIIAIYQFTDNECEWVDLKDYDAEHGELFLCGVDDNLKMFADCNNGCYYYDEKRDKVYELDGNQFKEI